MLKRMNNKGFTVVEIVVSFALVVVVLGSMTALVVNYRDRVTDEEVITQIIDFKNTITKVVYDDITDKLYTSITSCGEKCIKFSGEEEATLKIIEENGSGGLSKGIYFEYKGIKYLLPDSDLNDFNTGEYMIKVKNLSFKSDSTNKIYSVKIPIHHNGIDKDYTIKLLVHNEVN